MHHEGLATAARRHKWGINDTTANPCDQVELVDEVTGRKRLRVEPFEGHEPFIPTPVPKDAAPAEPAADEAAEAAGELAAAAAIAVLHAAAPAEPAQPAAVPTVASGAATLGL
jgi:hypothetical protein